MRSGLIVNDRGHARFVRKDSTGALQTARSLAFAALVALCSTLPARAGGLSDALVWAYQNNPQLNAERARQRATDESAPQALSAYRPQISASASAGLIAVRNLFPGNDSQNSTLRGWAIGATITQTIFNGFKSANSVRQAESQVASGAEALRGIEQSVFLDVVTAYTNVYASQALLESQRANVTVLKETLDSTRRRLSAGDVTQTDVAQGEARLSRGRADLNAADVALAVAKATYLQVIGVAPGQAVPAEPVDGILPATKEQALAVAQHENPALVGAMYDIDTAQSGIKIAESSLYPTVTLQGSVSRTANTDTSLSTAKSDVASIIGQGTIPIYTGGLVESQIRQAKETLGQTRLLLDRTRGQVNTAVTAAWVTNEGARIGVAASEAELRAATIALDGVRREALAGQRTTLEVLNSLQDVNTARTNLIQAQRDRVVASYMLLAAVGRLDHKRLGLATASYDPQTHYRQVRDAWFGLRTPSGQ